MKFSLGRRSKIIGSIAIGIMLILSSTVFGLAKTGKINVKMLADVISTSSTNDTPGTVNVTVRINGKNVGAGVCVQLNNGVTSTTNADSVAIFNNIPHDRYVAHICVPSPSCSAPSFTLRAGGTRDTSISCTTDNGGGNIGGGNTGNTGGGTGGGINYCGPCATGNHCEGRLSGEQWSYSCIPDCTSTSCGAGNSCVNKVCQCTAGNCYAEPTYGPLLVKVRNTAGELLQDINVRVFADPVLADEHPELNDWRKFVLTSGSPFNAIFPGLKTGYRYNVRVNEVCPRPQANLLYEGIRPDPNTCSKYNPFYSSEARTTFVHSDRNTELEIVLEDTKTTSLIYGNIKNQSGERISGAKVELLLNRIPEEKVSETSSAFPPAADSLASEIGTNDIGDRNYLFKTDVATTQGTNYKLRVTADGYKPLTTQDFWTPINTADINIRKDIVLESMPKPSSPDEWMLLGKVTDPQGGLLSDVQVKVTCATNCGSAYAVGWTATTQNQLLNYMYPSVTKEYNFLIPDISRKTTSGTDIASYKIEYSLNGWQTKTATISQNDIKVTQLLPNFVTQYVGWGDKMMNGTPVADNTKFDWMGSVKMWTDNHLIGDLLIEVEKQGGTTENKTYTGRTRASAISNESGIANINFIVPDISLENDAYYKFNIIRQGYLAQWSETRHKTELGLREVVNKRIRLSDITIGYNVSRNDLSKLERIKFEITAGGQKASGASINISSTGCADFNETIQADGNGFAYYYSVNYAKFASNDFANCYKSFQAKVSKANYVTQVNLYQVNDFIGSYSDHVLKIDLTPIGTSTPGISGKVLLDGKDAVANAKIDLWKNAPIETPLSSKYSNTSGRFKFTGLSTGRYVLSAFKLDYSQGQFSRVYTDFQKTEQLEIVLNLYSLPSLQDKISLKIGAIRQDTTPLAGAKFNIKLNGLASEEKETDASGLITSKMYSAGDRIDIIANYSVNLTQFKTIVIPNYNDLNDQQKLEFQKSLIFQFDTANKISSVKFKVVRGSTPVPNARITYVIDPSNSGIRNVLNYPYGLKAVTKSDGRATLLSDFSYVDGYNSSITVEDGQKIKALTNENHQITVDYSGKTYIFNKKFESNQAEIILDIGNLANDSTNKIKVFLNNGSPYNTEVPNVFLEKKVNNTWQKVSFPRTADGNSLFFTPDSPGIFRAGLAETSTYSDEGEYDGNSQLTLYIGLCEDLQKGGTFTYWSDDVLFYFTDTAYEKYLSSQKLKDAMQATMERLISARSKTGYTGKILLTIGSGAYTDYAFNASLQTGVAYCRGVDNVRIISIYSGFYEYIASMPDQDTMELMLTQLFLHEFGHAVYDSYSSTKPWLISKISSLYNSIKADNIDYVWNALKDGNIYTTAYGIGGHPQDKATEMFASFFAAYFGQHDRFYGIIRYHCPAAGTNILGYMWQLFAENVGKLYTDDNVFFKPINGRIGNIPYSYSQIKQGLWRSLVLSNTNVLTAARTLYTVYLGKITSSWSSSLTSARLNLINTYVTARLGTQPTGNINLTVKDSNNVAMSNVIVQIGQKYCLTNQYGKCKITKLPIGQNQILKTNQYKKNKNLTVAVPTTKSFTITSGSTSSGLIKFAP